MKNNEWKTEILPFDDRRDIIIPGNLAETIQFSVDQLIQIAQQAIADRGVFTIALSGGSTPHAIFQELSQPKHRQAVDWTKVLFFWSDERNVPADDLENNYGNAMRAGLDKLPVPSENIFRMEAEENIETKALQYEKLIQEKVPHESFDLVMLGMGEDGHTASLFPHTHALHTKDRLVVANFVPQKKTWRMSFTFDCINNAKTISIYVMGEPKADKVVQVLTGAYTPDELPIQRVGTPIHKALWILDKAASRKLVTTIEPKEFH
jgi:6-phosphogluconolactonase